MVGHRAKSSCKHSEIDSCVSSNKGFSNSTSKQEGSSCFRKCHSSVLSQQTGGGGTHSLEMWLMIWHLTAFCNPRSILLWARHIQDCPNLTKKE